MINGNFDLPQETVDAMKKIRASVAKCAAEIDAIAAQVKCDTGRLIHTVDLLQQVKNCACDGLILPHYKPEEKMDE